MKKQDTGEWIATGLAYTIPALQFVYALLGKDTQGIFLFREQFVLVSVFTAGISYALILLIREKPYFSWAPFQKKRKNNQREWEKMTNISGVIFTDDEVKKYVRENSAPTPIFHLTLDNLTQRILLPLSLLGFVLFFALGLLGQHHVVSIGQNWWTLILKLIQAWCYITLVALLVFMFAIYFYRNKNQKDYEHNDKTIFERALALAREKNSFQETQSVSLLGHMELKQGYLVTDHSFLLVVGEKCYALVTDNNVRKIEFIHQFKSVEEGSDRFFGNNGQVNGN